MKTLVLEPDPVRARAWVARYGVAHNSCDVAQSPGQARLMLIAETYDRLCLRPGQLEGQSHAILSVARACNPECEVVDLNRKTRRPISGPSLGLLADAKRDLQAEP